MKQSKTICASFAISILLLSASVAESRAGLPASVGVQKMAIAIASPEIIPTMDLAVEEIPDVDCGSLSTFMNYVLNRMRAVNISMSSHLAKTVQVYDSWYVLLSPTGSEVRTWPAQYFDFVPASLANLALASEKILEANAELDELIDRLKVGLRDCRASRFPGVEPNISRTKSLIIDHLLLVSDFYGSMEGRLAEISGSWASYEGRTIQIDETFFADLKVEHQIFAEAEKIVRDNSISVESRVSQLISVLQQGESQLAPVGPSR